MKIYFIRHGETDYNKKLISQGQKRGIPINQTGIIQSKRTGLYLKNHRLADGNFDCIYSSPLLRSKQTAEIIADEINYKKEIIYDSRLMEKDKGDLTNKKKYHRNNLVNTISYHF